MQQRCIKNQLNVSQAIVAQIMKKLDPVGVDAMHGCIDGYSRRVLWLNVLRSNKDPKEVCNLFINYLTVMKGVPRKIVADRGTEKFL